MRDRIQNLALETKRYFGFVETNTTWRQRWRDFLVNEHRSFDRLIGVRPAPRSCSRPSDRPVA